MSSELSGVVKLGGGPRVPAGAAIRAHLRFAETVAQLDDDAQVSGSTYEQRSPVVLRLDPGLLRPEIFEGLQDLTEGSTMVIRLDPTRHSTVRYVEIWIESFEDGAAAARSTVASIEIGIPTHLIVSLQAAIAAGTRQANGYVISTEDQAVADLVSKLIAEVRESEAGLSAPHALPPATGNGFSFLLSPALWKAVRKRIDEEATAKGTS